MSSRCRSTAIANWSPDQLDRIRDSILTINETFGPYGITLVEVAAKTGDLADIRIGISHTSDCGTAADGVLGCNTIYGEITGDGSQKGDQGGSQNEHFGSQKGDHLSPFLLV